MKTWFSHSGKRASPVDITGDVLWRDFVEMDIDEYRYKIQIEMHKRYCFLKKMKKTCIAMDLDIHVIYGYMMWTCK